jgi:hypothetical protein
MMRTRIATEKEEDVEKEDTKSSDRNTRSFCFPICFIQLSYTKHISRD